jgi:hypothetical protein
MIKTVVSLLKIGPLVEWSLTANRADNSPAPGVIEFTPNINDLELRLA